MHYFRIKIGQWGVYSIGIGMRHSILQFGVFGCGEMDTVSNISGGEKA